MRPEISKGPVAPCTVIRQLTQRRVIMTTAGHATLQPIGVLEHMGELAPLKFSASEVTTLVRK